MSAVSPLPGLIRSPARNTVDRKAGPPLIHRWATQLLPHEDSDFPGRIAISASFLAAAFSLGDLVLGSGFLGVFPYQVTRSLLYAATLLSGCIIAGGFPSRSRTARYTAVVATTTIAAYSLAIQLGLPGGALAAIKVGYGVALLGGTVVWGLGAVRRWMTRITP
jgi:hypothetical protein